MAKFKTRSDNVVNTQRNIFIRTTKIEIASIYCTKQGEYNKLKPEVDRKQTGSWPERTGSTKDTVNILLVKTDQFKHEIRRNLLQIRYCVFFIWTAVRPRNTVSVDGSRRTGIRIIIWLSLTYEELNKQLIIESPKYDIWSLLSNIGVRVSQSHQSWLFGSDFWCSDVFGRWVCCQRALTDGNCPRAAHWKSV